MTDAPLVELRIDALDAEGRGRASHEGGTVIVPGGVPGATVRVRLVHRDRRGRHFAEIAERVEPGQGERVAPCHHAAPTRGRCGGCPLMHLTEHAQRQLKLDNVNSALAPLGHRVEAIRHVPPELGWRNRTTLQVFHTGSGSIRLGSRAPRTGEFARMRGCLMVHPSLQQTADAIEDLLPGKWRRPEASGTLVDAAGPSGSGDEADFGAGFPLRHVSLRCNERGRVLVELVTHSRDADISELVAQVAAMEQVAAVWTGFRESDDSVLRSDNATPIVAPGLLPVTFDGRSYPLDPSSFFQLNIPVAEGMAARLVDLLGAGSSKLAWDLYCGAGVLGHTLLQHAVAASVIGADVVQGAVETASTVGSTLPGHDQSRWIRHDLDRGLPVSMSQSTPPDLVVLNPPRRGISPRLLAQVVAQRPPVIAVMSCNPETFASDARILLDSGWTMGPLEAWDMMPQTLHVEVLGVFRR